MKNSKEFYKLFHVIYFKQHLILDNYLIYYKFIKEYACTKVKQTENFYEIKNKYKKL